MSETYEVIEAQIQQVLVALAIQNKPNITKTSKDFHVPAQQLRARWKGRSSKTTRPAARKKLILEQEIAIYRYLDRLDTIGTAARRPMLIHSVNSILCRSHNDILRPPPTVGHNWPKRFLNNHLEYHICKQKFLSVEQKNSHEPRVVRCWFENYLSIITSKGISSTNIYNMDETGFRMGIGRNQ